MKKAKKSEITAFVILACCIVFACYYLTFLSPAISRFLSLYREVSATQCKLDAAELSIDRTAQIKKEIDLLKHKADFYRNKLPKEEEYPEVLESLSKIAKSAGVKITKILPSRDVIEHSERDPGTDIYTKRIINITAQCGYHQLGKFIAEMESAERFMEVSDISITSLKTSPKRHDILLLVNTYILKGVE